MSFKELFQRWTIDDAEEYWQMEIDELLAAINSDELGVLRTRIAVSVLCQRFTELQEDIES